MISLWDPWHGGLYPHLPVCRRSQCGHSGGIGWKPGVGRLERALGLQGGDAGGDGFGQVAPAVDLLHDSDEDALADRQQPDLGKVGCRTGRLPGRGAGPGCSGQHRSHRRFGAWRRGRRAQASFCADLTEWLFPLRKPRRGGFVGKTRTQLDIMLVASATRLENRAAFSHCRDVQATSLTVGPGLPLVEAGWFPA